ncbi:MAG TPA: hypothetical protein VFC19_26255 [Candidatus Limnocylindrales bacterium]|nr:hypothetical protein [Candidatus Limnocylindrales bacterium]
MRIVGAAVAFIAAAVLFFGYLGMAMTMPINADGASNALQAWEMLHGNVLLKGWTVTDVPFYSTELPQYALIELFYGLHEHVFRIASAMTYTLLVILVALLAMGRGRNFFGAGLGVAIMLLPMPGVGYLVAFGGPNHLGTAVPLLVTWLALDRLRLSSKLLPVVIGVLLVWGQVGDPLVMYVGAAPLAIVSAVRWYQGKEKLDLGLLIAAVASVLTAKGILTLIDLAGGFEAHSPPTDLSNPAKWFDHLSLLGEVTLVNFGAYLPDMKTPIDTGVAVIRLAGLALAITAVVLALRLKGDRVNQILAVAIGVNCAAFIVSTLPTDLLSARQVSVVLPLGAALAGRVIKPRWKPVLAGTLVLFMGVFAWHALQPPRPEPKREMVAWLESRGLRHGLGSYWNANDLTLIAQSRIIVAPVIGTDLIKGYRWESKVEWYDPARHDARFIIIDTKRPAFGTVELAIRQFGPPTEIKTFDQFAIIIYDKNLLAGLPAECGGWLAPSMLACEAVTVESATLPSHTSLSMPPSGRAE